MKDMKKFVFMELLVLVAVGMVFFSTSSESDVNLDLFSVDKNPTYREWTGSYAPNQINTRRQIYDIGHRLGRGILYQEQTDNDPLPFVKGNPAYKYSAARIYGDTKRGADVIYLGETATVDTIKCLRMIISGYLQSAFVMSSADSDAAALKICYWNTSVYDNNKFFEETFDEGVLKIFKDKTNKIGLSSNYKDWPGNTRIVIPHAFLTPVVEVSTPVKEVTPVEEVVEQSEPIPVVEEETPVEQHEVVPVSSPKKGNSFVKGLLLWSLIAILIAASIVVLGLAWYFAVVSAVAVMLIGLLLGFGIAIAKIALSLLPFVLALIIVIRILNNSKKPAPITKDDIDDDDDKTIVEASGN